MKIGVIQASSQIRKNKLLYDLVSKYSNDSEVINFGCFENEDEKYSYIEISLLAGLLLASGAVDFIVSGCSSGQGMMLACNNIPNVLCGYIPTAMDAYLFVQINNGNAVSVPLGEEYTWKGEDTLEETIKKLFSEPFGQGYPRSEAQRKLKDTLLLKDIRKRSQKDALEFYVSLDADLISKIFTKKDVIKYISINGTDEKLTDWVRDKM
ncbi:MAG: RpiB/LacA/LacB family sugar-phosphate isomerase [Clostridiales bacterium]|nr:RpiB/LacA/LacB family sugar-phosphate isomerase [Clostridiales bacterium]